MLTTGRYNFAAKFLWHGGAFSVTLERSCAQAQLDIHDLMKRAFYLLAALLVTAGLVLNTLAAEKKSPAPPPATAKPPPGYEAAQTISMITGVAISPLLGVGAVGCYEYFKTMSQPKEERRPLHWYAQPWFWLPALLIVGLVMFKDVAGTAAPTVLKKPMDVAEAVENKVSGLIAAGAFVPLVTQFVPDAAANSAQLGALGFAALDLSSVLNTLMVPFAIAAFVIVWLASHAINILILISPFTTVDMALKSFRVFLLSLVTATHFINPYFGALFSLALIVVAYFIAGWSFRLLVMGNVFIWDYLTFRRLRFTPKANGNAMFTGCKIGQAPIRTYGRLFMDDQGALRFEYRPWLFLPKKTLPLPPGQYAVGRGLFYPEILKIEAQEEPRTLFILPPHYRTHEEEVRRVYQFGPVQDVGLLKGFKAVWNWLKGLFGFKSKLPPVPAAA